MQYMMMFYEPEHAFADRADKPTSGQYWGAWSAYIGELYQSGVVVSGAGLLGPDVATTIRLKDGERLVQDGPVSASKEQLGGYFVIEVEDLDAALAWAARAPSSAYGATEVRPVMPPMPG